MAQLINYAVEAARHEDDYENYAKRRDMARNAAANRRQAYINMAKDETGANRDALMQLAHNEIRPYSRESITGELQLNAPGQEAYINEIRKSLDEQTNREMAQQMLGTPSERTRKKQDLVNQFQQIQSSYPNNPDVQQADIWQMYSLPEWSNQLTPQDLSALQSQLDSIHKLKQQIATNKKEQFMDRRPVDQRDPKLKHLIDVMGDGKQIKNPNDPPGWWERQADGVEEWFKKLFGGS